MDTVILLASLAFSPPGQAPNMTPAEPRPVEVAELCFSSGERTSGMNKMCFYDCASGQIAITVKATELCPLSVNN